MTLGPAHYDSPERATIDDNRRVAEHIVNVADRRDGDAVTFEVAGPRRKLYFAPGAAKAGIVTCGGLCPGLNNVIRSLVLELHYTYGVTDILGFRFGYQGLDPVRGEEPIVLTPDVVRDIHNVGGTMLGTSRGPVDLAAAVRNLVARGVNMLFTIGGDGTQRGANALFQEARAQGYKLAVVGIPKTVDNDVAYCSRTFGYLTAVEESAKVLDCAHTEALSVQNGISLVKLMGRHAGFIAAGATMASQDVNMALIPEAPFRLDGPGGLLAALKKRILARSHALIVVAEGAGQDLLQAAPEERDASGNVKLKDIGGFLKGAIETYFKEEGIPVILRYFDPNYIIRSVPADAEDAILCDLYARSAVHAAMAGKTGLVIGLMHDIFIHVPIEMLSARTKRLTPDSAIWHSVLASTGQPAQFV